MTSTEWLILALVVAMIVGPFATLRGLSQYRARRDRKAAPPPKDDDADKPEGFW